MLKENEENFSYKIPILSGSFFDLTKFDFSFKGIKILDIKSRSFKNYLKKYNTTSEDKSFIDQIIKEIYYSFEKRYAIVNIKPSSNYNYDDILNVWKFLLIIHPSDLQIEHLIDCSFHKGYISFKAMSSWDKHMTGNPPGKLMVSSDEHVNEINSFAKLYFNRLNLDNYVGMAIENYLNSFTASHKHYQYLTLFIALENLIHGNGELTYRLKRTIAILCGEDQYTSNIIYVNLGKLYSLRSKIIHGEKYSSELVIKYLKPLTALVSRTIIELLIHNIKTNEELGDIITKLAFGDRSKISNDWKSFDLNILTYTDAVWTEL